MGNAGQQLWEHKATQVWALQTHQKGELYHLTINAQMSYNSVRVLGFCSTTQPLDVMDRSTNTIDV